MSCSGQVLPGSVEKMADFQCTVFHHRLWWKTFFLFVCLSWFDVSFFSFFFIKRRFQVNFCVTFWETLSVMQLPTLGKEKRTEDSTYFTDLWLFKTYLCISFRNSALLRDTVVFLFFFVNRSEIIFICFAEWQLSLHCLIFNITG